MNPWEQYKKLFYAWEGATAKVLVTWLKSPLVLEPAGAWLSMMMKVKAESDKQVASAWGLMGLPTKRDQERTLHALNQIQSRLIDLEEQLADLESQKAEAAPAE
ncbi:MAG: hypothetical protein RIF41_24230 [Polyangiaceae bacterium]